MVGVDDISVCWRYAHCGRGMQEVAANIDLFPGPLPLYLRGTRIFTIWNPEPNLIVDSPATFMGDKVLSEWQTSVFLRLRGRAGVLRFIVNSLGPRVRSARVWAEKLMARPQPKYRHQPASSCLASLPLGRRLGGVRRERF